MTDYAKKNSRTPKWIRFRIVFVGTVLALCLGVIIGRAVQLQLLECRKLSKRAAGEYKKAFHKIPSRGTIYDQNRKELAVSIDVSSICAYPKQVSSPKKNALVLARALNVKQKPILEKLSSDKRFVWIKRHAKPKEVSAVKGLNLDGIDFVTESRRFYPMRTLAAQVIGFCGTDGRGLEGVEYQYNTFLSGREGTCTVFKDALGRCFTMEPALPEVEDGYNLILTIDKNIQHIAEEFLSETVEEFSAKSGIAVIMDPSTGAVLAIAHVPFFNPNSFERYDPWLWRNRAITDSFEPGSTFKIILAAAALGSGCCTPDSKFDCEQGRYEIGSNVVHDIHTYGELSLRDILKYSSNIGASKIGEKIGTMYFYEKVKAFGFGTKTGIDCPGETAGLVLPLEDWSGMDALAICFGQGISVSALQLSTAICAIANDGVLMKPYLVQAMTNRQGHLVKSFLPKRVSRVISSETARSVTRMLERVVAKGGTGIKAAVKGYRVAGKTGTAQKANPRARGYVQDKHTAAFVGFVPARDPRLVILVVVDEPKKHYYGGVVAAPTFRRIASESLHYLKVPPELVTPNEATRSLRASRGAICMG